MCATVGQTMGRLCGATPQNFNPTDQLAVQAPLEAPTPSRPCGAGPLTRLVGEPRFLVKVGKNSYQSFLGVI